MTSLETVDGEQSLSAIAYLLSIVIKRYLILSVQWMETIYNYMYMYITHQVKMFIRFDSNVVDWALNSRLAITTMVFTPHVALCFFGLANIILEILC